MKLLIVDDETRTRESLRNYVSWDSIGISDVVTARNGVQALEVASTLKPDVIVCDIRMPKLNGIEFAKQYRAVDATCPVIFLSGFADREYLKSAIDLKAFTFLDKPVNLDEVKETVQLAVESRLEEAHKQKLQQALRDSFDRSLPFLRQEMVRKLITKPDSQSVFPALQSQETFLLPPEGPYTVVVAETYWQSISAREELSIKQDTLLEAICQNLYCSEHSVIAGFDSVSRLVCIIPGSYGSTYLEGRATLEQLASEMRSLVRNEAELRFGVGATALELVDLPVSYQIAWLCSSCHYYNQTSSLIFEQLLGVHRPIETNWEEVRLLRDQVRRGHNDEAIQTIQRWTVYARQQMDLDISRLKDTYFQFVVSMLEAVFQLGVVQISGSTERKYVWKEIERMSSLNALESYVVSFIKEVVANPHGSSTPGSGKMREIKRYVHSHFHEKGFTIRTVAEHVQLSETYLCAFFKKQSQQTLKEYITETRMNRAKELLKDPNVKLFEVSSRIGISDSNYFTTFFKRNAGCTPSEYRERMIP